jgi:subtilisin family serine protease
MLMGGAQPVLAAGFPGQAKVDAALLAALAQGGEASYLVYLQEHAALAGAEAITDRDARGQFVYQALKAVADRTQAPLLAHLAAEAQAGRVKEVKSFFSVNALGVTSTEPPLRGLAAFPEVARIISAPVVRIPEPLPGVEEPKVAGVEWNIAQIHAPTVWDTGVFGQGIVVANIDTGVQFTHPALVNQYRGNQGDGIFDHNYNWWDPSQICGNPSTAPCDNNGHGSHTMGIMVGDDGGANQIGVAPQAQWFACKGCETNFCSSFALLECGDFILAPWDLNKANSDVSKRPHVVNNSWGDRGGSSWYQGVVQSWRAAGIFPAFANGNAGPSCNTSLSPGDYPDSFSSGATDSKNTIAPFSSRGPSAFGVTKPDVAAPGMNVRSSVPTNRYASFSGTSMASPHTAGTVALLWAAAPALSRDIATTEDRLLLTATALLTTQGCGGDFPNSHPNNVFGWGLVDAFAVADTTPPVITLAASPATLWPPNGKMVPVTIAGTMTDSPFGVNASTAAYAVTDEYGLVQPSGKITLGGNGNYVFTIQLQASRDGNDKDGRQYTITVSAQDNAGNKGSAATGVTVPHDQGH